MTEDQAAYQGRKLSEQEILVDATHYRRLADLYKELAINRGDQLAIADVLQNDIDKKFYPKEYAELLSLQDAEREINSRINQEK